MKSNCHKMALPLVCEGKILVRLGIIGAGFIGEIHANALKSIPGACLYAVCDADDIRSKSMADKFGCRSFTHVDTLLGEKEIDAVLVCIPTFLHEDVCCAAFASGKHVFCEKPLTLSSESAKRIISASERSGKRLMAGQVLRFWPSYVAIKKMIDEGTLGKVRMACAVRLSQRPWSPWFFDPEKSGGALYDFHIHDIDILRCMFGPLASVYANGVRNEQGAWVHIRTVMNFVSGVSASAEGTNNLPNGYPFSMSLRVSGDAGTAEFSMVSADNVRGRNDAENWLVLYSGEAPQRLGLDDADAYRNELQHFVRVVSNGDKPIVSTDDSLELMIILDKIKKSLETGEIIAM